MAYRSHRRSADTGLLGSLALLVVAMAMLAALTPLSFGALVGSVLTGVASGLGALPVPLLAVVVITIAVGLWRRWR